jgi:transcriptional regulator with XRE-family HTH domain
MPKHGPHPTDKYVGGRLRTRRLMLALSQTQLGETLGVSFQQVQKYENGANRIGAAGLQRISEILQVPVEFFFEGAPDVRRKNRPQTDAPSPQFASDYLATSDGINAPTITISFFDRRGRPLRSRSLA